MEKSVDAQINMLPSIWGIMCYVDSGYKCVRKAVTNETPQIIYCPSDIQLNVLVFVYQTALIVAFPCMDLRASTMN